MLSFSRCLGFLLPSTCPSCCFAFWVWLQWHLAFLSLDYLSGGYSATEIFQCSLTKMKIKILLKSFLTVVLRSFMILSSSLHEIIETYLFSWSPDNPEDLKQDECDVLFPSISLHDWNIQMMSAPSLRASADSKAGLMRPAWLFAPERTEARWPQRKQNPHSLTLKIMNHYICWQTSAVGEDVSVLLDVWGFQEGVQAIRLCCNKKCPHSNSGNWCRDHWRHF